MNLVRHELDFSNKQKRFSTKSTCVSIYSRAVNAEIPLNEVIERYFPWFAEWEAEVAK